MARKDNFGLPIKLVKTEPQPHQNYTVSTDYNGYTTGFKISDAIGRKDLIEMIINYIPLAVPEYVELNFVAGEPKNEI